MDEFVELASNKDLVCVSLPFAQIRSAIKCPYEISLPLSPIDWYALIKYSSGYIGNNMHPIVVSLHNQISFSLLIIMVLRSVGIYLQMTDLVRLNIFWILLAWGIIELVLSQRIFHNQLLCMC